jgi:hypothetical protein
MWQRGGSLVTYFVGTEQKSFRGDDANRRRGRRGLASVVFSSTGIACHPIVAGILPQQHANFYAAALFTQSAKENAHEPNSQQC